MNCLVVAATTLEIAPFLEFLRSLEYPGRSGQNTDILITGVGLSATTYSLTKQIAIKVPDLIIQVGLAGCFDKKIPLGTVMAVKQEAIADQGTEDRGRFKDIFDLNLTHPNRHPYSRGWLVNNSDILKKVKLKKVRGISVNEISTSSKKINLYKKKLNPVVESMEGAALHYVSLMEQVPFIQLRGISNYVGERNKKFWNLEKSIANVNLELVRLLEII
jgi:futalosine hydrolase